MEHSTSDSYILFMCTLDVDADIGYMGQQSSLSRFKMV